VAVYGSTRRAAGMALPSAPVTVIVTVPSFHSRHSVLPRQIVQQQYKRAAMQNAAGTMPFTLPL
jgi:hypothetical protein